ncbi:hypothetical protein QQF64_033864 [Cirrhinus molitorella]|uniref:CCHC-type domain-containing protein n=1 Tax=Cirrhinus molitorella TaxID=172907 RepID=A0ABR3MV56_9TELE
MKLTCYNCGQKGHKAAECTSAAGERREQRQWCRLCKSATHNDFNCRWRKWDKVKQAVDDEEDDHTFAFKVEQVDDALVIGVQMKGSCFKPQSHILELAGGERASGIALKKGTAKLRLKDNKGRVVDIMLMEALYVPPFSQDIFSVKAAIAHGATVIFKEGQNMLIHKNATQHFPSPRMKALFGLVTFNFFVTTGYVCGKFTCSMYRLDTWTSG